ncbi:hypothetical protein GQ43DRAFT_423941 [Delitschia confertaspora ATCC 74209]|uniref:NADH dehydrogenase [ubiquinone] 1 alpha subcomplex assembly factor 3 n=1 Tax=Delitschia confertaspora ATCC 74209 TaxID=1513339 RepID=A0A9P4MS73_9PLEO|nr:hypothetical protein GQ43DRAFT_423941 [Delitschia confertaspora ATCC 74209]
MDPRTLICVRLFSGVANSRAFISTTACLGRSASPLRISQPRVQAPIRKLPQRYYRCLHSSSSRLAPSHPPKSRDRGPKSEEDTQTDFGMLDVLRNTAAPATAIDACTSDGFALNNQVRIVGSGVLLVAGEVFRWRPWIQGAPEGKEDAMSGKLTNSKRQWEVPKDAWGILDLVWPKPDLLIIGTGPQVMPIAPSTRKHINDLGIRVEVQDTRNAAAQFNLLATERGVQQVAAAMIPIGWTEEK